MAKKNLNQTETNAVNDRGAAMKEKSPAFARYVGVFQKIYASVPFWALSILVTVIAVLQMLDVISMFSIEPVYGVLQIIPFLAVMGTAALMWFSAFHAKCKSDCYYPVRGVLLGMIASFTLFLISSIAISFVTSGFGAYLGALFVRIKETSLGEVISDFSAKFSDALAYGERFGGLDLQVGHDALKPAASAVVEEWWETLIVSLIFGAIVMLLFLAIRGIRILKVVAAARNSVEYSEKVSDAIGKKKQYIIYGIISFVLAALLFLLDPLLKTVNFVTTAFKFTFSAITGVIFGDGTVVEFMAPGSEAQTYLELLSIPLILVALVGLLVFAVFQIFRIVKFLTAALRVDRSMKNGTVPYIRLTGFGVVSIVLAVLMMSNGITWCASFFFSRVGGISLLTAIGKVLLIAVVILMVGILALKNGNELEICHRTQRKENGENIDIIEKKVAKTWSKGAVFAAIVGCVVVWGVAQQLMSVMDSFGHMTMQILPFMGSYDLNMFGGGLMNELLFTINELGDKMLLIFANMNQLVLRVGLAVAAIAWILSRCRFYKAGYTPDATQKLTGGALIAPKVVMYIFSAIAAILCISRLFMEGSWMELVLAAISSAFDLTVLLILTVFFMRKGSFGKTAKLWIPVAVGTCASFIYTILFGLGMPLTQLLGIKGGVGVLVTVMACTLVFQVIRWLFANAYYQETNNLLPVVFFDFMMAMMMNFLIVSWVGTSITHDVHTVGAAWVLDAIKSAFEVFGATEVGTGEVLQKIMPMLLNSVLILLALAAMLAIGIILLIRNMKAEKLPSDELCDLDHEEDEEFVTEAEALARQEAEAAKAK